MLKRLLLLTVFSCTLSTMACADYANALNAVRQGNYFSAVQELEEPAAQGDAKAQYLLGYLTFYGHGTNPSDEKAFALFEKAAAQGHARARSFMAYMYDEGRGVPQDRKQAFVLYSKSAQDGDVSAIINLGAMYAQGKVVPQDYTKAFQLFNSISSVQSSVLKLYLANFYHYGTGVAKDMKKSIEYYKQAASLGNVEAHYILGYLANTPEAKEAGVPSQFDLYQYAAFRGHPYAQFNLGTMYASGALGSPDRVKAFAWFNRAAEQGVDAAKEAIRKLEEAMSLDDVAKAKNEILDLQKVNMETVSSPVPRVVEVVTTTTDEILGQIETGPMAEQTSFMSGQTTAGSSTSVQTAHESSPTDTPRRRRSRRRR